MISVTDLSAGNHEECFHKPSLIKEQEPKRNGPEKRKCNLKLYKRKQLVRYKC